MGEANGKSSTFTIKYQSVPHTDCVDSLCREATIENRVSILDSILDSPED